MIDDLPKGIRDIAEVLGLGLTARLVAHFGGVELRIPQKLHPEHKLMALGEEDARALCEFCPGDTILVPVSLDRQRLAARVRELEGHGLKRWQIARKLGISQRHVRRLANGSPPDNRQGSLF